MQRHEKRIFDLIVENFPDKNIRILDLAPGEGLLTKGLLDAGFKNIEAFDINPENFKLKEIPCHKGNLNDPLPIEDAQYDLVISVEAIEHLEFQYRFIAECRRVLKKDGWLALSTPNIGNFASRIRYLFTGFYALCTKPSSEFEKNWVIEHIYPLTYWQLRHMMHTNGLFIKQITTDHIRRSSISGILFWPFSYLLNYREMLTTDDIRTRKVEIEIIRQMQSMALYFGRHMMVLAHKEDFDYKKKS